MSESRRELERLIDGIDEEISDARRDIKEAEAPGDGEAIRRAQQDIAALKISGSKPSRHLTAFEGKPI